MPRRFGTRASGLRPGNSNGQRPHTVRVCVCLLLLTPAPYRLCLEGLSTTHPLSSACHKKTSAPSFPAVPSPPPSSLTPYPCSLPRISPAPASSAVACICRRLCTVHALIHISKECAAQLEGAVPLLIYISSIVSVKHFFYTHLKSSQKDPWSTL